jgi:hypothetical protein
MRRVFLINAAMSRVYCLFSLLFFFIFFFIFTVTFNAKTLCIFTQKNLMSLISSEPYNVCVEKKGLKCEFFIHINHINHVNHIK